MTGRWDGRPTAPLLVSPPRAVPITGVRLPCPPRRPRPSCSRQTRLPGRLPLPRGRPFMLRGPQRRSCATAGEGGRWLSLMPRKGSEQLTETPAKTGYFSERRPHRHVDSTLLWVRNFCHSPSAWVLIDIYMEQTAFSVSPWQPQPTHVHTRTLICSSV